ncbi:MAG TPA: diaminopimelate decarboxylase, partial [Thermodesulfovibrionia bacterium]|nr:diaminopimelate decarboxylase [Thermodesulfovibrionia bacterium]
MNFFHYRDGQLYAEGVSVQEIAEQVGTPLYIYSHETIKRHINVFTEAFKDVPHIICYALKANPNGAILRTLSGFGAGADIVSGGELYRALEADIPPKKIVYAGVGKRDDEIRYGLEKGILMFNVESSEELHRINHIASTMGVKAPVALRVNPDINPETHPYITTGMKTYKFGIPIEEATALYRVAKGFPSIEVVGIHKHIGSQIVKVSPFVDAIEKIIALYDGFIAEGIPIRYIDMGGGLGITYSDEAPPDPVSLAKAIVPLIQNRNITLILEPGRSIVGNAGIFVSKVLYRKETTEKTFVIVDGGMNDLIRPSLYGAYHHIQPVEMKSRKKIVADVVGPICESGDFFAKGRQIEALEQGELLAVMSAGAYGFSMSSNYNSRPRAAEVLVKDNAFYIVTERETY